jgi:hypothetical protein
MMRVLAWKEMREQAAVWLTLLLLTVSLPYAGDRLLQDTSAWTLDTITLPASLLFVLVGSSALVCGGLLLAGEAEAETQTFLDGLPAYRVQLWWPKFLVGLALALSQALVAALAAVLLGMRPGPLPGWAWFWLLPAAACDGLMWGLVGSALRRTVFAAALTAAALFVPLGGVVGMLAGYTAWLLWHDVLPQPAVAGSVGVTLVASLLIALPWARHAFCLPDRRRRAKSTPDGIASWRDGAWAVWWHRVLWLAWRQAGLYIVAAAFGAVVVGWWLPRSGLVLWASATTLIGVVCGLAVFGPEQTAGAHRFVGDQRLPPGQVWLAKTVCWFALSTAVTALILLASLTHLLWLQPGALTEPHLSWHQFWGLIFGPDIMRWGGDVGLVLVVWMLYAFALGQCVSLLISNLVAAMIVASVLSMLLAASWLPWLGGSAVQGCEVLGIPLLLLLTAGASTWSWATDQMRRPRAMMVMFGAAILIAGLMAVNFAGEPGVVPGQGDATEHPTGNRP